MGNNDRDVKLRDQDYLNGYIDGIKQYAYDDLDNRNPDTGECPVVVGAFKFLLFDAIDLERVKTYHTFNPPSKRVK